MVFLFEGKEIKLSGLKKTSEITTAHSYLSAIICAQFFDLARILAEKKGVKLWEFFEDKNHFENAFKNYISTFGTLLIKNAVLSSEKNWQLIKEKKELNKKIDA